MMACRHGCTLRTSNPTCPNHGDAKGLRVVMPNETGCFYVDADHSYWRMKPESWERGTRLTGVTTITKTLDIDPKNLLKWAARTNGIGVATLAGPVVRGLIAGDGGVAPGELAWLCDHETIWETLEREHLTYDDVRDAKAVVGTNVHELAFQALAAGRPVPHMEKMTEEERGYAEAVMAFWLDHDPRADQVEQIVVDPELGVAGRTDFHGRLLTQCDDPSCPCSDYTGTGVIDAKTGNFLGESSHAQVGGYRGLLEIAGFGPSQWGALLKLRADGSYELVNAEGGWEEFCHAVTVYRDAGEIKRKAGKAWRERK